MSDVKTPVRTVDLAGLATISAAATQDELEWADDGEGLVLQGVHTGKIVLYAHDAPDDEVCIVVSESDRALIAAASAPVVTALIARIGELHQALLRAAETIDGLVSSNLPQVSDRTTAYELYAIAAKGTGL